MRTNEDFISSVQSTQCPHYENACLPPTIPHGKYDKAEEGWYKEQDFIRIQCDDGYVLSGNHRPTCRSGNWSSLPVCERRKYSCSEPPKISHAVIIHPYQEVFSAGSKVQYECEKGYTQKGNSIIVCEQGQWSAGPTCNESSADQVHPASDADVQPEGREASCVMDPARYARYALEAAEPERMHDGQEKYFSCTTRGYHAYVRCTNRKITLTSCCNDYGRQYYRSCYELREPN
ncbi:coagulation factor XIII B chain-like [Pelmatolapia mariae]|uniref:coagulation factor XIII B chain-like n=1 Tax=Pelmatolapia mariae TaxID=158779 RepID=UPI003211ED1C